MGTAVRRLAVGMAVLILLVVAIGGGAYLYLTRTQGGHERLMGWGLGYLESRLDGTLAVGGIRSSGIFQGLRLTDVRITGLDGRPFLQADSLRVRYSLLGLVRGDLAFSELELWQPVLIVERFPDQEATNAERIFRIRGTPSESTPEAEAVSDSVDAGEPTRMAFEDVSIHGGNLFIRLPPDGDTVPAGVPTARGPDGALLREFALQDLDAYLPRVRIAPPEGPDEALEVQELSGVARAFAEPVRIREFRGELQRSGTRLGFEADRIWLPDSEFAGTGWVDWGSPDGLSVSADLEGDVVHLRDLRWVDARLPDAGGAFDVQVELDPESTRLRLTRLDLILEESRVRGEVGLILDDGLRLVDTELHPQPLALRRLDPWLDEPLPVQGLLRGRIALDGTSAALSVDGRLTLEEPGAPRPPTTGEIAGILHLEEGLGATGLRVVLDPFYYGLLGSVDERVALRGPGRVNLTADGRLGDTLRFDVRATHRPSDLPHSNVRFQGTAVGSSENPVLDVTGSLEPLSFTALARYYPETPLTGEASGTVELVGPLSDLDVRTRVATPGGVVALHGRLDVRSPARGYRVEAQVEDFELSSVVPAIPAPTLLTGRAEVEGRGLSLDSLDGSGVLSLRNSRMGHLRVDTLNARLRAGNGVLQLDTVVARTSVADVLGAGTLALTDDVPGGRLELEIQNDSLGGVRPFLLGDTVIAGDTLSPLERNILELEGVNPDTLPTEEAVAMHGRFRGQVTLEGSLQRFSARGGLRVEEVTYGDRFLRSADLDFTATGLPDLGRRVEATLVTDSVGAMGRVFEGSRVELEYEGDRGRVDMVLRRSADEDYRAQSTFEVDSLGGVVHLDALALRFEPVRWNLGGPATISWSDDGIVVRDFRLVRPGEEQLRIMAEGTLPFRGEADFRLEVDSLALERVAQLAQIENRLRGTVGLRLNIGGTAAAPVMDGTVSVRGLVYDSLALSLVQGGIRYADQRVTVGLLAWQEGRNVLTVDGFLPADLAFRGVEQRFPDEEMDLRIRADSAPAASVLSFLGALDDVEGVLEGEVAVQGTLDAPAPTGTIRVRSGATSLSALGTRIRNVEGSFDLSRDGVIRVDLRGRSVGTLQAQGTIALDPASDPKLDLRISANNFRALNRRDIQGNMGGEVTLEGTYRRPLLRGDLRVEQGVLFLEEFTRSAEVVDLSDPAFFDVVDTSLVAVQPILAESRNPFLSNLRADVDLVLDRDSWIRSPDINVELQGRLTAVYDRTSRDLALVGTLQAIRGWYNAFGRRFQVEGGTVEFVGTPGINPSLNIQAVTRLRRPNQEPLNITANVEGTLKNPRVALTSDAQPAIPPSDLVGYLVFGRPASLLGPGEQSVAGGASQLLGGIAGAGATLGLGALTAQLSSAVAQQIGFFDYFAITTGNEGGLVAADPAQSLSQSLTSTQIEVGRYLSEEVFLAVLLRPLAGTGGQQRTIPGARLEWRFADLWTVEAFVEDRFARTSAGGFGDLSFQSPEQILGVFFFREWGY